jgi:monothiol glutaredoxin
MRSTLPETQLHTDAAQFVASYHRNIVTEVEKAIKENEWVVVGMSGNPFVTKARKLLTEKKMTFKYIEQGSYFSKWKERLAIKIWSGWPTFPQVFHKGKLIGGFNDLKKYLGNQT